MSYEQAKEALDDLYALFDRGELMDRESKQVDGKAYAEEIVESLKIDGYLTAENRTLVESITPKLDQIFGLVEAIAKFSEELFHERPKEFGRTYQRLKKNYLEGKLIPHEFLKRQDFLKVYEKIMRKYA